jgi:hypothetical protein
MLFVAKGNLEELIDINFTWSLIFLCFYYFFTIFLNTGVFHQIQVAGLKKTVLLNSLHQNDILEDKDLAESRKKDPEQIRIEFIDQTI